MTKSSEITVIEDENGLTILGDPAAIEPWLEEQGIKSTPVSHRSTQALAAASKGLQLTSTVMENSGRWVKLSKETAQLAAKSGNTLSGGVIRSSTGSIVKHVKFQDLGKMALANPGVVAGVGGIMAQVALEQSIKEITDYLDSIDKKVDDLLRDQKDRAVADLVGIGSAIDEAMLIRDSTGEVGATTWSKVAHCGQKLAYARGYAIRKVEGLTSSLATAESARDVDDASKKLAADLQEWLAILARAVQLQDMLWVVELERVMKDEPSRVDLHRQGIAAARQDQIAKAAQSLSSLVERMTQAATLAADKKVLHPMAVSRTIQALNHSADLLTRFAADTDIGGGTFEVATAPAWRAAMGELLADTGDDVSELRQKASDNARAVGVNAFAGARELRSGAATQAKRITGLVPDRIEVPRPFARKKKLEDDQG